MNIRSLPKTVLLYPCSGPQPGKFCRLFRKCIIIFISVFLLKVGANAQAILVTGVSPNPVCAGSNVTVTFDVTNGGAGLHYNGSSSYQAYLSNAAGNSFVAVGSTFTVSATYNTNDNGVTTGLQQTITIPAGSATGSGYKISIGSTNPLFTGSGGLGASGAFTINALLTPSVSIAINLPQTNNICAGTSVTFTATPVNGGTTPGYQWQTSTDNGLTWNNIP